MKVGVLTNSGKIFQHICADQEVGQHINWLELRVARMAILQFTSPGNVVQLHLDNMTAIIFIKRMGGNYSYSLYAESQVFW